MVHLHDVYGTVDALMLNVGPWNVRFNLITRVPRKERPLARCWTCSKHCGVVCLMTVQQHSVFYSPNPEAEQQVDNCFAAAGE